MDDPRKGQIAVEDEDVFTQGLRSLGAAERDIPDLLEIREQQFLGDCEKARFITATDLMRLYHLADREVDFVARLLDQAICLSIEQGFHAAVSSLVEGGIAQALLYRDYEADEESVWPD